MATATHDRRRTGADEGLAQIVVKVPIASGQTTGSKTIDFNGTVFEAFVNVPDITGATATINCRNEDESLYYTSGALDKAKEDADAHHMQPGFSAVPKLKVEAISSSSEGDDRVIKVVMVIA